MFVTPHVFAGGAEKAALSLASSLNSMGLETRVATLSVDFQGLPQHFRSLDYILPDKEKPPLEMGDSSSVLHSVSGEMLALTRLIDENLDGFDVLNPCNIPSYWAAGLAKRSKPVVWTCSEVLGPYGQTKDLYDRSTVFRLLLRGAGLFDRLLVRHRIDTIVTCSELNQRLIRDKYGRSSTLARTAVDYDFFSRGGSNEKQRLGLEGCYVLLQVGSLIQRKNQVLSIRALKVLKSEECRAKLMLVGKGPWEPTLREEVHKLGLDGDVIFVNDVTEEDLRSLYHACDVNLFPAVDQTYGLVPFEALASGKPSIVSSDTGASEIIAKERIGLIIDPSVDSLVSTLRHIRSNPEEVKRMVARGAMYVRQNLTWQHYARTMLGVFETCGA